MLKLSLAFVALATSLSANAAVVFSDSFDGEGIFQPSILNYSGFANWNVVGQVDLVDQVNGYGISDCSGKCVDLDGTSGPGQITLKNEIAVSAGDLVTIDFKLSGNQRNLTFDEFFIQFNFSTPVSLESFGDALVFGTGGPIDLADTLTMSFNLYGAEPSDTYGFFFKPLQDVSFTFGLGTRSADDIGPVIDNVSVGIVSGAVPEPATWAMLIAGFGMVGFAARRRRALAA